MGNHDSWRVKTPSRPGRDRPGLGTTWWAHTPVRRGQFHRARSEIKSGESLRYGSNAVKANEHVFCTITSLTIIVLEALRRWVVPGAPFGIRSRFGRPAPEQLGLLSHRGDVLRRTED